MVLFAYLGYNCSVRTRGRYEVVPDLPSQKRVVVAPFIPAHNLSRGLLQAIHALFSYALMLAAMSVSARYYSPSWVVGFVLGEMLFGQWRTQSDQC